MVASIVNELQKNNTTVISVNTDNAANNIKALNGDENSAQELSNAHFIRQPCAAHTLNLVVFDIFEDSHSPYYSIYLDAQELIKHAPRGTYRNGYHPSFQSIRWRSFCKNVEFICNNLEGYKHSLEDKVKQALDANPWHLILNILQIFDRLLLHWESNSSTIADIIPAYNLAIQELSQIGDPLAAFAKIKLQFRFKSTCSLKLPWVAYLLTQDGLQHFRNSGNEQNILFGITSNALMEYMTERGFDDTLKNTNIDIFHNYLKNFTIDIFKNYPSAYDMWDWQLDIDKNFRSLVKEILIIPCTETACERLFSALSATTTGTMCNISPETVNARLMVKFEYIFENAGKVNISGLNHKTENSLHLIRSSKNGKTFYRPDFL